MNDKKINALVRASLFAAMVCVGTFIRIPLVTASGYVHLGDAFVLSAGFVLGTLWGALAGGVGAFITDIFLGYPIYAPATFVIKAVMAVLMSVIFGALTKKTAFKETVSKAVAALTAEVFMVLGYFIYEAYVIGMGKAALGNIPSNLIQAVFGILIFMPVSKFVIRIKKQ